jgi:hypothetical protein
MPLLLLFGPAYVLLPAYNEAHRDFNGSEFERHSDVRLRTSVETFNSEQTRPASSGNGQEREMAQFVLTSK